MDENFEKEEKDIYHYHHQKENINSIGGRWADSFGMPNILCGDGSELPYWETRVFFSFCPLVFWEHSSITSAGYGGLGIDMDDHGFFNLFNQFFNYFFQNM